MRKTCRARRPNAGLNGAANPDQDTPTVREGPRRSGPHGPRADPRRPAPRCQPEDPLGLLCYLAANLKFPFKAKTESDGTSLTVSRLIDPKEYELDEEEGLLCEAREREKPFPFPLSELDDAVGNRKLVEDYGYWFWNWH